MSGEREGYTLYRHGTYLGIGTPDSKVKDPRGEARTAMAVAGVAGLKL